MLRGAIPGAYPYPFIDAATLGYGRVVVNAVGLLAAFVTLGYALLAFVAPRAIHTLAAINRLV